MCHSPNVTPPTQFRQQSSNLTVQAVFDVLQQSWNSPTGFVVEIGRCRLCLDCGYVLLFITDERLTELRESMGKIRPLLADP
jgi:hypothetical protein